MRWWAIALACLSLTGCAYIGEPMPPALKIPERVTDLSAVQRGGKIYIHFTPPKLTTEGLVIEHLGPPDLRIEDTPVPKETSAAPWVGQTVQVRLRFLNTRGRVSDWSNVVLLEVVPPLTAPDELRTEMTPGGARIYWRSDAPKFRVFREGELLGTTTAPPYLDVSAAWGQEYKYSVQAVQPISSGEAESELSAPKSLSTIDTFPPAAPTRFTAIAGVSSIELSWERSTEPDIAFYRLYRDGKVIADKLSAPNASDTQVQSGVRYRYAVTAVDHVGNESPQSAVVEIVFP